MTDIVDATEHCRACNGKGHEGSNLTERGTYLELNCYYCRGTGLQTVRVNPKEKGQ